MHEWVQRRELLSRFYLFSFARQGNKSNASLYETWRCFILDKEENVRLYTCGHVDAGFQERRVMCRLCGVSVSLSTMSYFMFMISNSFWKLPINSCSMQIVHFKNTKTHKCDLLKGLNLLLHKQFRKIIMELKHLGFSSICVVNCKGWCIKSEHNWRKDFKRWYLWPIIYPEILKNAYERWWEGCIDTHSWAPL